MKDAVAAKSSARLEARARRKALTAEERQRASESIRGHVIADAAFVSADIVLTYVPVGSEADVFDVAREALRNEKRAAIPRTEGDVLSFDEIDIESLTTLEAGAFGIPVARASRPVVATTSTLLLVPLLAFDRRGHRLGAGKGFYDRFLTAFPGVAVGVAFATQELDAVPTHAHDRRLDAIVTEHGLERAFRNRR